VFIRGGLAHEHAASPRWDAYPSILRETYELAIDGASGSISTRSGEFAETVERLWSEWESWHGFFARPPFPDAKSILSWREGSEVRRAETGYRPARNWLNLTCPCEAPAGSRVSVELYPLPAIAWIRSARWLVDGQSLDAEIVPGKNGQLDCETGVVRIWLFCGQEQLAVRTPAGGRADALELEILLETGSVITGLTFKHMAQ